MKRPFWLAAFLPILLFAYLRLNGYNMKAVIFVTLNQMKTGASGFYGLSMLLHEPLGSHPAPGFVKLGYFRALKLKYIYLMRFIYRDNYLYSSWLEQIHQEILKDLQARNAPMDEDAVYEIPVFEYATVDPQMFFNEYVKKGRPAILRNTRIPAMDWTPDNLMERYPDFIAKTRCISGATKVRSFTFREYVESRNGTEVCYLDNNAELFEQHPELLDELEIFRFAEHMAGQKGVVRGQKPKSYIFSQIFLSVHESTGALFHAANYYNLFFMIHGRKKWTFVDPSNTFLMYPMFNELMRDTKSFLTWNVMHAHNSTDIINKHFPLYRYCPKYTMKLQPGDLLTNPPWNWHMVENFGSDSIGVASRWALAASYPYTSGQLSFQQFISADFWRFMYHKAEAAILGTEFKYNATSHLTLDAQMNFGRVGSIFRDPKSTSFVNAPTYQAYLEQLKASGYFNGQ